MMHITGSQTTETKRQLLAEIAEQLAPWPKLARLAAGLAIKFKPTVADTLRRTSDLARWLYVYEQPTLALQVCQLLNDLPFENDYNRWNWVEFSLALEWMLRTQANQLQAAQACIATLQSTYAVGPAAMQALKQQAVTTRLAGNLLPDFVETEQLGDWVGAQARRFTAVGELLFMQALGGSVAWPVPVIEHQLAANLASLRA